MDSKKKTIILTVLGVITLIVFAVGVTYAYFTAQGNNVSQADVNVKTATTDSLIFTTGNNISFTADQTTFAKGMGNKEGSSYAKATLKANNSTNSATANYYVYLDITNNTFKHTTTAKTGELILTVIDPEGNPVTSVNGLDYVTVNGISGFDITEATSLVTIVDNHEIVSTGIKEEKWDITITLVNLDEDQSANAGSSFTAKLKIQKEKEERISSIADACVGTKLGNCIASNYKSDSSIFYHDTELTDGVKDGSYRYEGNDYQLTEKATLNNYSLISDVSESSTKEVIQFYCNGERSYVGNYCLASNSHYYTLSYDNTNTQYSTYQDVLEKAVEDGYLTKDNVKNFVCFGSNDSTCNIDNLYRIIGVFDNKLKLIKYDYASKELLGYQNDEKGDYAGSMSASSTFFYSADKGDINKATNEAGYNYNFSQNLNAVNDWTTSQLNYINLNNVFINNIGTEWSDKIFMNKWIVGGNNNQNIGTSGTKAYENEITSPSKSTTYDAKVGLMYVSDYALATYRNAYSKKFLYWPLNYSSTSKIKNNNWIYMGKEECTITPNTSVNNSIFTIRYDGSYSIANARSHCSIRPTFYLNSDVKLISGTGTSSDPYRIS